MVEELNKFSLQHLAAIIEDADDAVISKDLDGVIMSWNPAAERIFGYTRQEVVGRNIRMLIPEERQNEEDYVISNIKQGRRIDHYITERLKKDGSIIPLSITISPIKDGEGIIVGASIIARDITLYKEAEDYKLRLTAIVESSDSGVISESTEGIINSWNPAAVTITGYSRGEILGKSYYKLIPESLHQEEQERFARLMDGEKTDTYESRLLRKDGLEVPVEITASLLRNAEGELLGLFRVIRDIRMFKNAEASRARLAAIIESSYDAIVSKDLNGIITSWNPAAEALFGHTAQEAIGQSIYLIIPPDKEHEERSIISRIRKGERVESFDTERVNKWGERVSISVTISPIIDVRGNIIGASKIARDIRERKFVEKLLLEKNAELESLSAELNDLNYIVSHDLKSPLRAIGSLSTFVKNDLEGKLSPETQGHLNLMQERVKRMNELLNAVLEYSRAGRVQHPAVEIDIRELNQKILDKLSPPDHVKITYGDNIPKVYFDKPALKEIFTQLLSNAIKFNDKDQCLIHISAEQQGDMIVFHVSDNGTGINPRYFDKIFKIFQVLSSRDETEAKGIGLAIVKKILMLHGGSVWLDSEPGKGSTFSFAIPKNPGTVKPVRL